MTKRTRTPTILALLIAAVLAGGYLIVTQNNSAMNAGLSCGRCAASLRLTGCAGHRRFAPDASNPAVPTRPTSGPIVSSTAGPLFLKHQAGTLRLPRRWRATCSARKTFMSD